MRIKDSDSYCRNWLGENNKEEDIMVWQGVQIKDRIKNQACNKWMKTGLAEEMKGTRRREKMQIDAKSRMGEWKV